MPRLRGNCLTPHAQLRCPVHISRPIPAPTPHPALATAESLSYGQIHDDTPDEHTRAVRRTVVVARLSPRATSRHLINVDGKPVKYELAERKIWRALFFYRFDEENQGPLK